MKNSENPSVQMENGFKAILEEDYSLAENSFETALKGFNRKNNLFEYVACLGGMGQTFMLQSRYFEAERVFKKSLQIYKDNFSTDYFGLASILTSLASIYFEQKKFDDAAEFYEKALSLMEKVLGKFHPTLIQLLESYESTLRKLKRIEEATEVSLQIKKINKLETKN